MTISLEKIFFCYILNNKQYFEIVDQNFFRNNEIQLVYNVIRKYMVKNIEVEVPSPKQILEMVQLEDREGIITKDILKSILTTDLKNYDENNFIIPKLKAWILSNNLKRGGIDIVDELRSLDQLNEFDDVLTSVDKIRNIVDKMTKTNFADDEDLGSDFDDPEMHAQDTARFKVKSGFETIDHMLGGGWDIQTLNVIMAETNNGKCFFYDTKCYIKNKDSSGVKEYKIGKIFTKISKGDYNI